MNTARRYVFLSVALLASAPSLVCQLNSQERPPSRPDNKSAFRFAVVGDTGTGGRDQYKIAQQLAKARNVFRFDLVIMLGDNLYGKESPKDFQIKFEKPYEALLTAGVKFYASLGNHDDVSQRFYKGFNMGGKRYYTFRPFDNVRFFALDSNYMDKDQLAWLEKELKASGSEWKLPFFHHPLYSSGETHGSSDELRSILEPFFLRHEVPVVFAGHEHFYEHIKPQKGITYFTVGSSAKLRRGDITRTELTEKGFDSDNVFMLCEIQGDTLTFQTITKTGRMVDQGTIVRRSSKTKTAE